MRELSVQCNCVAEWSYTSSVRYDDPFHDLELDVLVTDPDGNTVRVPAYWAGGQEWRVRFAPSVVGSHRFYTECSDDANPSLHAQEGQLHVDHYDGDNPLLRHGPVQVRDGRFQHLDGTPFFWLGDTWWMGAGKRFRWPGDFQSLTSDRKQNGFSVVQLCAAFACGMEPFDPRDVNEAGWAWEKDFTRINPGYFDLLDLRVEWLVRSGLVPCLLGAWGYHLVWMGTDRVKKHWRYLIARYGAYPVVWCIAGEGTMPYYLSEDREGDRQALLEGWSRVTQYVRAVDPYGRPVTMHPVVMTNGRDNVVDDTQLDFDMLQPGHAGYRDITRATRYMLDAVTRTPRMPVVNDEVNYEGVFGANWQDMQRFLFWSTMLSGAAGFTYGATGIWEFNTQDSMFGPFPHGVGWGDTPWEEAYQFPGSRHVGIGRRILERYPWWRLEPHQEWVDPAATRDDAMNIYCAGIPRELRVCYLPFVGRSKSGSEGVFLMHMLEPNARYNSSYIDPRTGVDHPLGDVKPRPDGTWPCPSPPQRRDWVVVLKAEGSLSAR